MDYAQVEQLITPRTKAIIPVDLAGIPCDYERLMQIVENKRDIYQAANDIQRALGRVAICADAAHAFGAEWRGKKVGSIADFTAFSFHAVKNLTTAEGGALTWKSIPGISDDELYRMVQLFSLHGQSKDALAKTKLGAWEYDIVGPWYKCNMTDIMAAIGLVQMKRYPSMLQRRKEIIEQYDAALSKEGIEVLNHYDNDHRSSGHLYITRIPNISLEQRQDIIEQMAECGIATNVHYKPLPMMTAYKNLGFDIANFPNAYARFANEITLPLHTKLTSEEIEYIIDNYIRITKQFMQ
jgi:dTDP-4-amino-4,6-dideoxygalactose transaminase